MQFINYFFASLSSFFGLLIGSFLIRIAPEEQRPLGTYFAMLKKTLLILAFPFFALYYFGSRPYFIAVAAIFAFLLFIEYKLKNQFKKSILVYAALGILFFLGSKNMNLLAIASSIVLLYGTAAASIEFSRKQPYNVLFYSLGFIIVSNLLFTISRFLF